MAFIMPQNASPPATSAPEPQMSRNQNGLVLAPGKTSAPASTKKPMQETKMPPPAAIAATTSAPMIANGLGDFA